MAKKNTHSHLPDESQKRESTNAHSEPNAKSIVHETMQRAHLQIEFFTCELAGVQSTVRVHPRAGLLDQVLEASSDHHRSRREAEKSACAHLLPKLREHLPEYIRATHRTQLTLSLQRSHFLCLCAFRGIGIHPHIALISYSAPYRTCERYHSRARQPQPSAFSCVYARAYCIC